MGSTSWKWKGILKAVLQAVKVGNRFNKWRQAGSHWWVSTSSSTLWLGSVNPQRQAALRKKEWPGHSSEMCSRTQDCRVYLWTVKTRTGAQRFCTLGHSPQNFTGRSQSWNLVFNLTPPPKAHIIGQETWHFQMNMSSEPKTATKRMTSRSKMNRLGRRRIYNKDNTYLQDIREGIVNKKQEGQLQKIPRNVKNDKYYHWSLKLFIRWDKEQTVFSQRIDARVGRSVRTETNINNISRKDLEMENMKKRKEIWMTT